jgi:hypothetical protein
MLSKYWTPAAQQRVRKLLDARCDELEADPTLRATTDAIITLAGGEPCREARRIALLSAMIVSSPDTFGAH